MGDYTRLYYTYMYMHLFKFMKDVLRVGESHGNLTKTSLNAWKKGRRAP